jgi:ABC-type uncharacterized transport system auxiliary subunit
LLLAACGSVAVPTERYYRLEIPAAAGGSLPRAGVLRVLDLQLGNALPGDRLAVVDNGVRVQVLDLHRWVAPLDRLCTDVLLLGLSRTQIFTLCKAAGDAGGADLELAGRIVEFGCHQDGKQTTARVAMQLWLAAGSRLVFRDEFAAEVPLQEPGAPAAVHGLSLALARVQDQLLARMRAEHVFQEPVDAVPGR